MRWVGVDPGVSGGAVCLEDDGRSVVWAVGWRKLRRRSGAVWAVSWTIAPAHLFLSLGEVAAAVCGLADGAGDYRLAVEGLFGRGPSLVTLAEASGRILGALEGGASGETWRPRSRDWRKRVLGISEAKLGAAGSERAAVALAPAMFEGLGELVTDGHVVEAACIALDGLRFGGAG